MLAGGPFGLGPLELGVIVIVLLLIFGVNKVGDLGGALGKSVREFRKAAHEDEPPATASPNNNASSSAAATPPVTTTLFCSNCGAQLGDESKFCAQCGAPTQAPVS
jgi:sec-independent protein translocase protein TatA